MQWNDFVLRLKALVLHHRAERDLAEELRAHIDIQIERNLSRGMSRAEAERAAMVAFGAVARIAEECRDERGIRWLEDFGRDLLYACRQWLKQKSFFAVAALTLSLGIGANTAIFSVVNGVLLRPLPYRDPERLANVWCMEPSRGVPQMGFALPDLSAVAGRNRSFEAVAGYFYGDLNITGGAPERVTGVSVSANLFALLGVNPALGRTFSPSEESFGSHHVVVLSDALWRRRFGARPDAIGGTIRLNGELYNIIGVMPADFRFPAGFAQLWAPMSFAPKDDMATRNNHFIHAIARLKPGVSIAQSRADLQSIARQLQKEFSENTGVDMDSSDYMSTVVGNVRSTLLILLVAVGVVLLIACVNVANLLLSRASARHRELSVRTALGASRGRLVRQLLTEAAVLGVAGACLGVALSTWLLRLIRAFGPANIPRLESIGIDVHVLFFTAALTLVSVALFGLAPAMDLARAQISEALKEGGRSLTAGARTSRSRDALVVAEVTLSLVLVIGAGLLVRTLERLRHVAPGIQPDHVLSMSVSLPEAAYPQNEPAKAARFYGELMKRLEQIPGVKAAAASSAMPIADWGGWGKFFTVEEHPASRLADVPLIQYREVTPHYLQTMGIPLREGRFFTEGDVAERPLVAVINESARRRFFPNENPLGKRVYPGPPEFTVTNLLPSPDFRIPRLTIVGVIGDVRQSGLRQPPQPELFVAHMQGTVKDNEASSPHMYVMIRTASDPLGFVNAARAAIQSIDPDQPSGDIATMEERLDDSLSSERFQLFLFGAFAGLALVLAAVGVYGVMSYSARLRAHEVGIRMALGAGAADVLRLMIRHGLKLGAAGVVSGTALGLAVTHFMSSLLFGIQATDALTFAGASFLLMLVIAVASFVPSLRAARTDPLSILRTE
ncbi:MAG TPA: ABC transporter permease [Bryobacteraceae bacterium]|nr:ABC transporter permease [Bryobacteraceae bacterium]